MRPYLSDAVADMVGSGAVPGAAAMAADRHGTVWSAFAGESRPGRAWAPDTVAWVASMTKPVVAATALRLVEDDLLELDAPLAGLLPELAAPRVLTGFDSAGRPLTRLAASAITLRRLMTHTAGNAYTIWNPDVLRYHRWAGYPDLDQGKAITLTIPLVDDPGARFEYGTNLEWVGRAIEAATGDRLEAVVRREVLDPLGMRDTAFTVGAEQRERLALLGSRGDDGVQRREHLVPQQPEVVMAGGALYSTPRDYLTFLRMLLGDGEVDGIRVLRDETVRDARANHTGDLVVGPMRTAEPQNSLDIDFLPGTRTSWSLLGLRNEEPTPAGRSTGSLFWAGLTNCYFWVDWERGETGLVMTQLLPFGDPAVLDLFDRVERAVRAERP